MCKFVTNATHRGMLDTETVASCAHALTAKEEAALKAYADEVTEMVVLYPNLALALAVLEKPFVSAHPYALRNGLVTATVTVTVTFNPEFATA